MYIFIEAIGCQDVVLFALPNAFITTNKQHVKAKQRCRDRVMSGFVSWCRHLVPHEVTSLHPPSFDFSTCIYTASERAWPNP